jgi:hypothetical protein
MIEIEKWMKVFLQTLDAHFGKRIWFVGLQGSYSRGEATQTSDIDIVVILDQLEPMDIRIYHTMLDTLPHRELICGFLSGKEEILNWELSDLFQFCHDTIPIRGSLEEVMEQIDDAAVNRAIEIGACNIYHGCVHNMLHEKSREILKGLYKSASFVIQAICNAMMLVLLWAAEVMICLFLCRAYVHAVDPSLVSHQTVGLAFYRNDFLHSLLPLADITVWIRNLIMLAVIALAAASFPYKQRRGKFAADIVSYALLTVIFFTRSVGDGFNTFITVFFGLCIAAEVIWKVFANEEEGEEAQPYENPYPYAK